MVAQAVVTHWLSTLGTDARATLSHNDCNSLYTSVKISLESLEDGKLQTAFMSRLWTQLDPSLGEDK